MDMTEILEWSAFAVGTVGTILWARGFKWNGKPVEGWFWLVSALLWIWFALINNHGGLAARDLLGVGLYLYGIALTFRSAPVEARKQAPISECPSCDGAGVHLQNGPGSTTCRCSSAASRT